MAGTLSKADFDEQERNLDAIALATRLDGLIQDEIDFIEGKIRNATLPTQKISINIHGVILETTVAGWRTRINQLNDLKENIGPATLVEGNLPLATNATNLITKFVSNGIGASGSYERQVEEFLNTKARSTASSLASTEHAVVNGVVQQNSALVAAGTYKGPVTLPSDDIDKDGPMAGNPDTGKTLSRSNLNSKYQQTLGRNATDTEYNLWQQALNSGDTKYDSESKILDIIKYTFIPSGPDDKYTPTSVNNVLVSLGVPREKIINGNVSTETTQGFADNFNSLPSSPESVRRTLSIFAEKTLGVDVDGNGYAGQKGADFIFNQGQTPPPPAGSGGSGTGGSTTSQPYRLVKGNGPVLANDKLRGNGNAVFIVSDSGELFHVTENLAKELDANGWWYPPEELPQEQIDGMTLRTSLNYTAELGVLDITPVGEYLLIKGDGTPMSGLQLRGNSDAVFAVDKNGNMFHVTEEVAKQMQANNTWMTPAILNQKTVDDTPVSSALASATGGTAQLTVPPVATTVASSAPPAGGSSGAPTTGSTGSSGGATTPPTTNPSAAPTTTAPSGGNTTSPSTNPSSSSSSPASAQNKQRISDLFDQYVGRPANEAELANYATALQGGKSLAVIRSEVSALPEADAYRRNLVWETYRGFVVREPTQEEYGIWMSKLASGEVTPEEFRIHIANAGEAVDNQEVVWSGLTVGEQQTYREAINKVYQDNVGRPATEDEVRMHAVSLKNAVITLEGLANDVRWSPEGRAFNGDKAPETFAAPPATFTSPASGIATAENKQRISDMFDQYVGRPANEDELNIYGTSLQNGKSIELIRREVADLPEAVNYRQTLIWETFRAFVSREPTQEDFAYWHERLANGEYTPEQFRIHVANDTESVTKQTDVWSNNVTPAAQAMYAEAINNIYRQHLGREATQEEIRMHGVALANGVITLDDLTNDVYWSPEARTYRGEDTPEYFASTPVAETPSTNPTTTPSAPDPVSVYGDQVKQLVNQYLGKDASAVEINAWSQRAANGEDIRAGIAATPEAVSYRQTLISETYRLFVVRDPAQGDFDYWHDKLMSGQYTPQQFRIHIINDAEPQANQAYVWSTLTPTAQQMYSEAINAIFVRVANRPATEADIKAHVPGLVYGLTNLTKLEQNIAQDVNSGGRKITTGQVLGASTTVSNVMSTTESVQSQEKKPEILGEATNSSDDGAVWVTDASGERRDISGLSWEKRADVQKHIVEGGGTFSQLDQVDKIYASGDPAAIDNWERFSQTGKYSPDTPWGATYQSVVKDGYSHELAAAWADGTHADNMKQATTPVNGVVGAAAVSTNGPNMFGVS